MTSIVTIARVTNIAKRAAADCPAPNSLEILVLSMKKLMKIYKRA